MLLAKYQGKASQGEVQELCTPLHTLCIVPPQLTEQNCKIN